MSRSYKSFGIGFAAPNDPRLSSPRIIASQTQAKILLKPPSIVLQSPPSSTPIQQSSASQSCITACNTALPPPLLAVSLFPSISQQKSSAAATTTTTTTAVEATEGLSSTTTSTTTTTTINATQTGRQTRPITTTLSSPFKTTLNYTPASYTLNQGNARSYKSDSMTTPNLAPSTSNIRGPKKVTESKEDDDDDIQSIIVIKNNSFSSSSASKTATIAATPTQPLTPSFSSPSLYKSNSSTPTKQNNTCANNINTKTVDHQKPQSSPQVSNITSPIKQTSNTVEQSNISDLSQNGTISQASFLKMKSRPKKNDRTTLISSVESLKKADEHLTSSLSSEDEKFSTPPNQPGQNKNNSPQSPNKLHQRQQQSQPQQQQQTNSQQPTNPKSLQHMQSKPQQPEKQQQNRQLQSPQQDSIRDKVTPSTSDSSLGSTPGEKASMKPPLSRVYYTYGSKSSSSNYPETPFSWDIYLKIKPAEAAPKAAFMQATEPIENNFKIGMKLEAIDPRNGSWCLASIVYIEGMRLKLRSDGGDNMNDFFELVDSENIRSVGSCPGSLLSPPTAFKTDLTTYSKFVEKILSKPDTVIAPPELFHAKPARPSKNFFKVGMKLEAVDRKNPQLICPATIGEVDGVDIKVIFDGWKGPFDYRCTYYSRDIFPINWCRDTGHNIMCPKGWDQLLSSQSDSAKPDNKSPSRTIYLSTLPNSRPQTPPARAQGGPKMKKTKSRKKQDSASSTLRQSSKSPPIQSPKDEEQPAEGDYDDGETTLEDNSEEITNPEQASCMRAIPIDVWRKMKQQKSSDSSQLGKSGPPPIKKAKRTAWFSESDEGSDTSAKETKHVNFSKDLISTQDNSQSENDKTNAFKSPTLRHLSESEIFKTLPGNPTDWTVDDVLNLIKADETLAKYSNIFESHEIDGKAFALLTHDVMINHMGLKIGPVLKIHDLIEQVKKLKSNRP